MPKNYVPRRNLRFVVLPFSLLFLLLLGEVTRPAATNITRRARAQNRGREDYDCTDQSDARSVAKAVLMNLPLSFEPASDANQFIVRGAGSRLLLSSSQATMALNSRAGARLLRMKLAGANPQARAAPLDPLPGKRNYLLGNDSSKWRTDVPTYARVRYDEVYPGISLAYYGRQNRLEYDFEIAPGADAHAIKFAFNRVLRPRIEANGDLVLRFAGGELRQPAPVVFQEIKGARRPVAGHYAMIGKREISFELGPYDKTQTLVIDPTLVYSTYLGGSGDDQGSSIAVDSNNNVYVAGTTSSINFPSQGPAFANNAGLTGIFVTKINAAASPIVYSTYIGAHRPHPVHLPPFSTPANPTSLRPRDSSFRPL